MPVFVSTDWLADRLDDPEIVVVDGTWHMSNAGRNARSEFESGHIPGALFFDIDEMADTASELPHMLPDPERFAGMAGQLGIASDRTIIVYDEHGLFSAPRVWWTLRTMGASDVRILTGGGPKWRRENRPLETGPASARPAKFVARFDPNAVADLETVASASTTGASQILDARPAARFAGEAPEPRPGLRPGHVPNSRNLPFSSLIENGELKAPDEIRALMAEAGIDPDRPVITSCGSGVTAAVLTLALEVIGAQRIALYDGSWAEWGAHEGAPVQSGGG